MDEKTIEEVKDLAKAKMERGTFDFLAAVTDRQYPEDSVSVFLDEKTGLELTGVREQMDEANKKFGRMKKGTKASSEMEALIKSLTEKEDELVALLQGSRFVVHVRGFSAREEEELVAAAYEQFPAEYDETRNPITGAAVKNEISDPKRDRHLTNLLWQKYVVKVEDADGNEDGPFSVEGIDAIRGFLPNAARGVVEATMSKVALAANWYAGLVDEVF